MKGCHRRRQLSVAGFTLSELLVAMTLSLGLIAGAVHVYVLTAQASHTLEAVATLEEQLTFALQAMTADVRLAGYSHPAAAPAPATCGGNDVSTWVNNTGQTVTAAEGAYDLPCPPHHRHLPGTDTLTVRHHDPHSTAAVLQAHGWYIDDRSSLPGQPSLRRLTRLDDGAMQVQEIIPGIDDLQVRFVVDADNDGVADGVTATATATGRISGVLVSLRARSAIREAGYGTDGYRRITVERLIALRNAPPE